MSLIDSILAPLIETVRAEAQDLLSGLEERAERAVRRLTRAVRLTFAEFALWLIATGLLFSGLLVLLTRFYPTDVVLIGAGIVLGYIALLIRMIR
jgi:hypothetical protein